AGKYGFEHSLGEFASYMGHTSTNSGAFRQRLAAMRDWKLIAGRGDNISMTDVARVIALPPDDETELDALRSAFKNCAIFYKLFEDMQKGTPLARQGLGNRAVHAFGVSPSSVNKFVGSFVDSAVAAGIALVDDNGQVTLLDLTTDFVSRADVGQESPAPQTPTAVPPRAAQSGRSATPVVHQAWPIDGGTIIFEIRSERPLPASAYATVGEVVASLERLSVTLAPATSSTVADESEPTE
ncbi:MAG TPA: hypothetical protein VFH30_18640, partial [Acidimicrobiales bacterium]|nr:hypothetical protein [Acidimicrobiales bacterium]